MRLNFSITPNSVVVPFNYQHILIGAFHKWMGWNKIHDGISLYSLSWLQGAKLEKNGFHFPNGATWFISFWKNDIGKQLIEGIMIDPQICWGMAVKEIQIQKDPEFGEKEKFKVATPVLIRKYDKNRIATHLTFECDEANYLLTKALKMKMSKAGINEEVNVSFDKSFYAPKTKLVKINQIKNKANFCPVIIEGSPDSIKFAWNVGIGHSTGCGFGAIY